MRISAVIPRPCETDSSCLSVVCVTIHFQKCLNWQLLFTLQPFNQKDTTCCAVVQHCSKLHSMADSLYHCITVCTVLKQAPR